MQNKIKNAKGLPKSGLDAKCNSILEELTKTIKVNKSTLLTEEIITKAVNFAKIIGEFKQNQKSLDLCL